MDDPGIVTLLRNQDPAGLARAYDVYGQRLYAYCRVLLRDNAAAEDVVQDTLLTAYQRATQLRNPESFRPWLYALARNECLRQLRARRRTVALEDAGDVPAEAADPGTRVHEQDLSRLVWQAAEGLNPREREALELSYRHGLAGRELAAALGVTVNHAQTLLARARQQLERGLGALLVGRTRAECPELADIVNGWDGRLTSLMRKRISRHLDRCRQCAARKQEEVNATALLAALPLPVPPTDLRARLVDHVIPPTPALAAIAARFGALDPEGFPKRTGRGGPGWTAVAVTVILLLLSGAAVMLRPVPGAHPVARRDAASPAPVTVPTPSGSTRPSPPTSGPAGIGATSLIAPSSGSPSARRSSTPGTTPSTGASPGDLGFADNPLDLDVLWQKDTSLRAVGGPVVWTADPGARLSITPSSGSLRKGQTVTVTVRLAVSDGSAGSSEITFILGDGSRQVLHVTWAAPVG